MRFFFALVLLVPSAAFAQQQQPLPVTLTPQEYQTVLADLMGRDAVIRMLVQKQQLAQQGLIEQMKTEHREPESKVP